MSPVQRRQAVVGQCYAVLCTRPTVAQPAYPQLAIKPDAGLCSQAPRVPDDLDISHQAPAPGRLVASQEDAARRTGRICMHGKDYWTKGV
jgi:hypothetical protein